MHLLLEENVYEKGLLFMFVFILKKNILRSKKKAFFYQVPNYRFDARRAVSRSNIILVVTVHCIWFSLGCLADFMFTLRSSSNPYPGD